MLCYDFNHTDIRTSASRLNDTRTDGMTIAYATAKMQPCVSN